MLETENPRSLAVCPRLCGASGSAVQSSTQVSVSRTCCLPMSPPVATRLPSSIHLTLCCHSSSSFFSPNASCSWYAILWSISSLLIAEQIHINHFLYKPSDPVLVTLSCPTLCDPWTAACQTLLSRDFPGKDTRVGCHFLLQGILPTQGSNPGLLHCRQFLYQLSYQGSSLLYEKTYKIKIKGNTHNLIIILLTFWWSPPNNIFFKF